MTPKEATGNSDESQDDPDGARPTAAATAAEEQ